MKRQQSKTTIAEKSEESQRRRIQCEDTVHVLRRNRSENLGESGKRWREANGLAPLSPEQKKTIIAGKDEEREIILQALAYQESEKKRMLWHAKELEAKNPELCDHSKYWTEFVHSEITRRTEPLRKKLEQIAVAKGDKEVAEGGRSQSRLKMERGDDNEINAKEEEDKITEELEEESEEEEVRMPNQFRKICFLGLCEFSSIFVICRNEKKPRNAALMRLHVYG
jgi:hypothetical protein